jgi:hypothetical protein
MENNVKTYLQKSCSLGDCYILIVFNGIYCTATIM